jgi:HTH-type transcriptional regulator/antitoxin MqsA
MKCDSCSGEITLTRGDREVRFPNRSVTIATDYYRCGTCGEILITPEQSVRDRREAADIIRREEGLLTTAEVREIRKGLGLRQREFERLLRVGRNTVARWEAGTVFQSPAIDNILRSLRSVPELAAEMAQRNNVALSQPRAASADMKFTIQDLTSAVLYAAANFAAPPAAGRGAPQRTNGGRGSRKLLRGVA